MSILKFILNSIENVKPVFFLTFPQCICFLNQTEQNPDLTTTFTCKIEVFCSPEKKVLTKERIPWKWILTIPKYKNEFPKQLGLETQMKKIGSFVCFSCLLPELWSLNCQNCVFLQFFVDASKKSKAVIEICVYVHKVLVSLF